MHSSNRALPPLATLLPFESAARWESFTRAAQELNLTQAAISRQVRALETDLGVALFERRNRAVHLTPAGRELADTIASGLGKIAEHACALRGSNNPLRVTLFCQLCEAFYWLMPRLADFHRRHPDIDLKLTTSTRPLTEQHEPFDVALQTQGRPCGSHRLAFTGSDSIFPVCSPNHPAASATPIPLKRLVEHDLLHYRPASPDWIEWPQWLQAVGAPDVAPRLGRHFDSYPLLIQAAVAGHGIALGWRRSTERLIASGSLVRPVAERLDQPEALEIYTPPNAFDRYASRALLGWLRETLESE
ncbi:LysR substrate-binding domain-containing protein [Salinicola halophilus]|uniref:LysR substrate-binding domain-containing protein n=1 Tax=Salinicola halophilus TaxID=184065 RepID=UPI000DA2317F|nr:LysR substrate-binding domain-containing protein [Salinicola halophilus]